MTAAIQEFEIMNHNDLRVVRMDTNRGRIYTLMKGKRVFDNGYGGAYLRLEACEEEILFCEVE